MVGYRMLAATCFDGSLTIFRVDHQDDGVTPRPSQASQVTVQNIQVPILGMTWQVDSVALLLACADNSIKKFDLNT